jgi:hypothetical protein
MHWVGMNSAPVGRLRKSFEHAGDIPQPQRGEGLRRPRCRGHRGLDKDYSHDRNLSGRANPDEKRSASP